MPLRDKRGLRLPVALGVPLEVTKPTLALGVALSEKLLLATPVRVGLSVGKDGKAVRDGEPLVLATRLLALPVALLEGTAVKVRLAQPVPEFVAVRLAVGTGVSVPRLALLLGVRTTESEKETEGEPDEDKVTEVMGVKVGLGQGVLVPDSLVRGVRVSAEAEDVRETDWEPVVVAERGEEAEGHGEEERVPPPPFDPGAAPLLPLTEPVLEGVRVPRADVEGHGVAEADKQLQPVAEGERVFEKV